MHLWYAVSAVAMEKWESKRGFSFFLRERVSERGQILYRSASTWCSVAGGYTAHNIDVRLYDADNHISRTLFRHCGTTKNVIPAPVITPSLLIPPVALMWNKLGKYDHSFQRLGGWDSRGIFCLSFPVSLSSLVYFANLSGNTLKIMPYRPMFLFLNDSK